MATSNTQLIEFPLFPLSSHVLTGGILPLRIFEARYLRMVKECYQRDYAFGMCMLNANGHEEDNSHIYPIGTLISIKDFEKLDDGQLGITVQGEKAFKIHNIRSEEDGLRVGEVSFEESWPEAALDTSQQYLVERLQELYLNYPELAALYTDPEWNNASWLALRWLEVLPVAPWQKQNLLQNPNSEACIHFLESALQKNAQ